MNPVKVADAFIVACEAHPEQRSMQVVVNALGPDPFHLTDTQAEARLWLYAVGHDEEQAA